MERKVFNRRACVGMLKTDFHDHFLFRVKLDELKKLATSAGYEVVEEVVQAKKPSSSTLFGRGKVQEIKELMKSQDIDNFIVYNRLSSIQFLNLSKELEANVMDRYDLTLEIFELNTSDSLSLLQIKLARRRKEIPLRKVMVSKKYKEEHASLMSGGEYAMHSVLKSYTKREASIKREIDHMLQEKKMQVAKRKMEGAKIVTIGGYYNSGKTTLFNRLTGADKPVSETPFTTLSAKYKKWLENENVLFVDTIGFVIDLDPRLLTSFEINLIDFQYADLLLFLVPANEPPEIVALKISEGLKVLETIPVQRQKITVVLNKIDDTNSENLEQVLEITRDMLGSENENRIIPISAKTGKNLDALTKHITEKLFTQNNTQNKTTRRK
ncbi:MAG: GTPase [Candidatus Jordarchaeaceae archaeon]